jgi:hypothetical protein
MKTRRQLNLSRITIKSVANPRIAVTPELSVIPVTHILFPDAVL